MRRILVLKKVDNFCTKECKNVNNNLPEPMPKYNPEIIKNRIFIIQLYSKL